MMTNAEHLLENAIVLLERHDPYRAYHLYIDSRKNVEMAAALRIPLDVVWEMAVYCDTTLRTEWRGDNQSSFRWIPVTERLPEAKVDVLAVMHYKDGRTAVNQGWYSALNEQWYIGVAGIHAPVTHWMPLPEPPMED